MACKGWNQARGSINQEWKGRYEVFGNSNFCRVCRVQAAETAPIWRGSQALCSRPPVKQTYRLSQEEYQHTQCIRHAELHPPQRLELESTSPIAGP